MKRIIDWARRAANTIAPGRPEKPRYRLTHIRHLKPGDRCWTPVLGEFIVGSHTSYDQRRDRWIVYVLSARDAGRPLRQDDQIYIRIN